MRMYLISDNTDTWEGMRLAGIEGTVLHNRAETEAKLAEIVEASDKYGIILITEKLRILCDEYVSKIMLEYKKPLILEIPDRHGFGRSKTSISDYIKKSIGLKI